MDWRGLFAETRENAEKAYSSTGSISVRALEISVHMPACGLHKPSFYRAPQVQDYKILT